LPAGVKVGAAVSAAAHHVGVSVATIIRASSCRATERPSCTLRPCLRTPTAAGRAPVRREDVQLPGPLQASSGVEHHRGEIHAHPPTRVGALSVPLFPLVLEELGGAATEGPAGGRIRLDNGQIHREVTPPVPCAQQDLRWASSIPGYVHLAVMRDPSLGKDLAEERLSAKVPIPQARLPA